MTWVTPHTWVTDEQITGALLNQTRDNLLAIAHPYDYAPSDVDVTNTTTETSLYSKVITGNAMGANGELQLRFVGDYLYNNSASDTHTLRIKFGGSTILTIGPTNHTVVFGSRFAWWMDVVISNRAAANAQLVVARFGSLDNYAGFFTANTPILATSAIDTTADQTLQITVQWSAASANLSWRKRLAALALGQN